MNYFVKTNKNLLIIIFIFLIILPFLGLNFLIGLIGNILLLLILIPLLLLIITFISFNSLRSAINICDNCGTISLGLNDNCIKCGAELNNANMKDNQGKTKPSETTIEVKAEEVK